MERELGDLSNATKKSINRINKKPNNHPLPNEIDKKKIHISHNIVKPTITVKNFENTHVDFVSRQNFHDLLRDRRSGGVVHAQRSTNDYRIDCVLFRQT